MQLQDKFSKFDTIKTKTKDTSVSFTDFLEKIHTEREVKK